jgi:hypothetical protein
MGHENYITLVDEIVRNASKEVDRFADSKEEAETLCEYLERSIQELCKNVREGFSE